MQCRQEGIEFVVMQPMTGFLEHDGPATSIAVD